MDYVVTTDLDGDPITLGLTRHPAGRLPAIIYLAHVDRTVGEAFFAAAFVGEAGLLWRGSLLARPSGWSGGELFAGCCSL